MTVIQCIPQQKETNVYQPHNHSTHQLAMNLKLSPNVTTIMTGHGNIRSYLHRLTNNWKSRMPMLSWHTNSRPSDIPVQKAQELNSNSEEQCT
jgi:hypothetical protein